MQLPPSNALPANVAWATAVSDALASLERTIAAQGRRIDTLTTANTQQLEQINAMRARINELERQ